MLVRACSSCLFLNINTNPFAISDLQSESTELRIYNPLLQQKCVFCGKRIANPQLKSSGLQIRNSK